MRTIDGQAITNLGRGSMGVLEVEGARALAERIVRDAEEDRATILAEAHLLADRIKKETERDLLALTQQIAIEEKRLTEYEEVISSMVDKAESGSIVKLNVGGVRLMTTKTTLTAVPGSLLGAMFSGRFPLPKDDEGNVFIDRDGEIFRYVILPWLRGVSTTGCGSLSAATYFASLPPEIPADDGVVDWRERIKAELCYYGLLSPQEQEEQGAHLDSRWSGNGQASTQVGEHECAVYLNSELTDFRGFSQPVRVPTPAGLVLTTF